MENNNINLLDLGDDILNIIGDYVKKDNADRLLYIYKKCIKLYEIIKKSKWNDNKPAMRHIIVNFFYVNNILDIETIHIFLTLIQLNLKRKKYPFSTYCIENLEDSIKTYDEILEKNTLDFDFKDTGVYCENRMIKFFK